MKVPNPSVTAPSTALGLGLGVTSFLRAPSLASLFSDRKMHGRGSGIGTRIDTVFVMFDQKYTIIARETTERAYLAGNPSAMQTCQDHLAYGQGI